MNEIEKIERYIDRTPIKESLARYYDTTFGECRAIAHSLKGVAAVALAFKYGQAKGYRAAKAEAAR